MPVSRPLRVYFVEDNTVIRDRLIVTLNEWVGITPVGHAEGEQDGSAWLTRADSVWDLAIVDLFLKQGNGLGVLQACRGRLAPRKVVVLTNYVTPDVRARCHAMGADAFFDKSSDLEALFDYCTQLRTALQAPPAA
ncbi:response regulator [Ottowia sp.]|uniref:response regulator n=1 Tax=Ottowia sp. TaxID=1898956 RepID=UPI00395945FE